MNTELATQHREPIPTSPDCGSLDVVNSFEIAGWVSNSKNPNQAFEVDIYDGDRLLTRIASIDFREDLLLARIGNGQYAFRFATPRKLNDGKPHQLRARVVDADFELPNSPKTYLSAIPTPPAWFMAAVAGALVTSDAHQHIGQSLFNTVCKVCNVKPTDAILDIGSGCGRVAVPFTEFLTTGTYDGIDIVLPMIEWCQQNITPPFPHFRFHHANLQNTLYSKDGMDAADYIFPFQDGTFDVVFATSVFSHLLPKSASRYASEIARVLKPNVGRAMLTFYLTHDDYRSRLLRGESLAAAFPHQLDGYSVSRLDDPEGVTAYEEADAARMLSAGGLVVNQISRGWWSGNKSGWTHQDAVLVSRRV